MIRDIQKKLGDSPSPRNQDVLDLIAQIKEGEAKHLTLDEMRPEILRLLENDRAITNEINFMNARKTMGVLLNMYDPKPTITNPHLYQTIKQGAFYEI